MLDEHEPAAAHEFRRVDNAGRRGGDGRRGGGFRIEVYGVEGRVGETFDRHESHRVRNWNGTRDSTDPAVAK